MGTTWLPANATWIKLGSTLDARIDRLGVELRAEMFREQRNQTLALIGANMTITAVLLAGFQLL